MDFNLPQKTKMNPNQQNPRKQPVKKWLAAALLASLVHAGMVNAAGLGRINVLSRLGQPFAAEIDLINVSREELSTLRVSLAPPAAYQAANMTFDPALNALRLTVQQRANGTPYIRATSSRRVTEPYLHLLVDLASQDSKFQRGYTALLDLPEAGESVTAAPAPAAPTRNAEIAQPPASASSSQLPQSPQSRQARPSRPARTSKQPLVAESAPPVVPTPRTPAKPAAPGNTVVAQNESKPIEPAKPEVPKPAAPIAEPAAAEPPKADAPKPEPAEPVSPPAPKTQSPALKKEIALPPQRGMMDTVKQNIALIGGVGLAGLAGLGGLWWALRRRKQTVVETGDHIELSAENETFASTTKPATRLGAAAGMSTAPSAARPEVSEAAAPEPTVANVTDSVDAVDEAKVYLEHGRDEQAERILREALSKQPGREDVQMLLLKILSARGDKDRFNQLARRLHRQTGGLGEHWKSAMAMGYALDPGYPLYSAAGESAPHDTPATAASGPDIDLTNPAPAADRLSNTTDILLSSDNASVDMDKTMVLTRVMNRAGVEPAAAPSNSNPLSALPAAPALPDFNFELPSVDASNPAALPDKAASAAPKDDHVIDFKIDFPDTKPNYDDAPAQSTAPAEVANDPQREALQQKMDLARAYREMGDKEGALDLLREVEHEGDAAQQATARELRQTLESS
jgi:pilus assembly protein FimV